MTSLLCVKNLKGSVQIHDADGVEELRAAEADDLPTRSTFMPRQRHRQLQARKQTGGKVHSSSMSRGSEDHCLDPNLLRTNTWMASAHAKDLETESMKETEATRTLYSPLLKTEKTFVHDVHQYLEQADLLALRKKELLHKMWSSQVYQPMRRKILQSVNSEEFTERDRRHRELYRQYLEYTNKKGFVFLDTMDSGEYYAQALNGHRPAPITVYNPALQDPLLQQGRERHREDQTILRCSTGQVYSLNDIDQIKLPTLPLVPLGRHNTNCLTWLEMPLGNIVSTPRKASRLRMKGNCTESQIDFGRWSKVAADPGLIDQELKSQKKRLFVNTPPFDRPPRPVLKPPFACCSDNRAEVKVMCPVSA